MSPSKTRLFVGLYIVDLHAGADRVYYAISKSSANEILSMGDEPTAKEAEARARWTIAEWTGTSQAKAAAATFPDESVA